MRVLVAPDSFKGALSSVEVARAIAAGWRRARPTDSVRELPLADGGEGTLAAIRAADSDWLELPAHATDPLGEAVRGTFLRRAERAVVELAVASGLSLLAPARRGPETARHCSTLGTGQILAAAIGLGCRDIVIGLGGSATTDGGAGLLTALGARFLDADGNDLPAGCAALAHLASVDLSGVSAALAEVSLTVASDVTNPLLGELGAAATYGPQKGADEATLRELDAALARYADVMEAAAGRTLRDAPGAGAAGGTGFGLLAIADRFAAFVVRPGVEVVMELVDFEDALGRADLVISGEGRVDGQTAHGKTAMGVAQHAHAAGVACLVLGGGVAPDGIAALAAAGAIAVPVVEQPMTVAQAMAGGRAPLERAAERTARLVSLGASLD
jgi:glycerate kinase